jgi:hypothetical protein
MPRDHIILFIVLHALRSCGDGPKRGWGLLRAEYRGGASVWALGQTGPPPGLGTWPNGPPARSAPPQSAHASRQSAISREPSAGSKEHSAPPAGPRRQLCGLARKTETSVRAAHAAHAAPKTAVALAAIRPRFAWFGGASSKIGGRPWPSRCTRAGPCPGLRAAPLPPSARMPGETAVATGGATGRRGRNWNGTRRSATDKARGKIQKRPILARKLARSALMVIQRPLTKPLLKTP